eukprot:GHVR01029073.1.p1 GENE.GHVR01029073.1~~GHVR01029073.1.p1  ORF type:complete len:253 (+),score=103.42 GHVR01029073.1:41-760(+)
MASLVSTSPLALMNTQSSTTPLALMNTGTTQTHTHTHTAVTNSAVPSVVSAVPAKAVTVPQGGYGRVSKVLVVRGLATADIIHDLQKRELTKKEGREYVDRQMDECGHTAKVAAVDWVILPRETNACSGGGGSEGGSGGGPQVGLLFAFNTSQDSTRALAAIRERFYKGNKLTVLFSEMTQRISDILMKNNDIQNNSHIQSDNQNITHTHTHTQRQVWVLAPQFSWKTPLWPTLQTTMK